MTGIMYKISELNSREQKYYLKKIATFLTNVESDYPRHNEWIQKVFGRILFGEKDRDILFSLNNNEISSCAILKNNATEKKICTLRVGADFRNKGLATSLIKRSIEELKTNLPIITVPSTKIDLYFGLLSKFGFRIESEYRDKYRAGGIEYVFNGSLSEETLLINVSSMKLKHSHRRLTTKHFSHYSYNNLFKRENVPIYNFM